MSEIGPKSVCVNYASKARSADDAEAQRETSAHSGLNHSPLKLTMLNPLHPRGGRALRLLGRCAGDAVSDCLPDGVATFNQNKPFGQGAHRLTQCMRRAIETRIAALEQEQAAAADEYEGLYARADTVLAEITERQDRLRTFREILLIRGHQT
jgi:hypothetical protein